MLLCASRCGQDTAASATDAESAGSACRGVVGDLFPVAVLVQDREHDRGSQFGLAALLAGDALIGEPDVAELCAGHPSVSLIVLVCLHNSSSPNMPLVSRVPGQEMVKILLVCQSAGRE